MPPSTVELHDDAVAEYDAAFDWYLERSSDAAVRFDAEVDRALSEIIQSPKRWALGSHQEVPAKAFPLCSGLSRVEFRRNLDSCASAYQPKGRILEVAVLAQSEPKACL